MYTDMSKVFQLRFVMACAIAIGFFLTSVAHAQSITPTGDYSPIYNGTDNPWMVNGDLTVGDTAAGAMLIDGAAEVQNEIGHVGRNIGSDGLVTVTGTNAIWDNAGSLNVGKLGNGTLNIENGGQVTSNFMVVGGSNGEGSVNVSGAASRLETLGTGGNLLVGTQAPASLSVTDGGYVEAQNLLTGHTGPATITVSGTGTQINHRSYFYVGNFNNGSGNLVIEDGANVSGSIGVVGHRSGSSGTVLVRNAGSRWSTESDFHIGGLGIAGGSGDVSIHDGGSIQSNGTCTIWNDGNLRLKNGSFSALGMDLDGGTIELEIRGSGTKGVDYDYLELSAIATLNGTIKINLDPGYQPAEGDSFFLVFVSSLLGNPTFDFTDAGLGEGLCWDTSEFMTTRRISIRSSVSSGGSFDAGNGNSLNGIAFDTSTSLSGCVAQPRHSFFHAKPLKHRSEPGHCQLGHCQPEDRQTYERLSA